MKKGNSLLKCFLTTAMSLFLFCGLGLAQPDERDIKRKADRLFESGFYQEALNTYIKYEPNDPGDVNLKKQMGICLYHTNQLREATRYFEYIVDTEGQSADEDAVFYLARTYHHLGRWTDAVKQYKAFLRKINQSDDRRDMVKDMILRCAHGLRLSGMKSQIIVENLGPQVNSPGDDFRPVQSPNFSDRLYFSSSRQDALGGRRNDEGLEDPNGSVPTDMYSTSVYNGAWTQANPLSYLLNSPRYEVVLDFDASGKRLYYFKGFTLYSGEILVDTFKTRVEEKSLHSVNFQGAVQSEKGDVEPYWYNDTIMLFASRREGGFGGLDLYISTFRDGAWGDAENLGPNINTPYDENAPFLGKDGRTLYYSTNNPSQSMGGYDIMRSYYLDRPEEWREPENLYQPINSPGDDLHFRLSDDGLKGYFSSDRKTGQGERDIFGVYFREARKEQTRTSDPLVFSEVPAYKASRGDGVTTNISAGDFEAGEVKQYYLDPLFYESNGEVLTARNNRSLRLLGQMLIEYPQLRLVLTCHSDNTDPEKYDLFFGLKRAEQIADYLIGNGVPESNVLIKSVGSAYPMANNETNGNPNPVGQRLNRRVDFFVVSSPEVPVRLEMRIPNVSDIMANPAYNFYQGSVKGLSYKVQISAQRQMYQGDALLRYPHAMVEKEPGSDIYQYTVGLYQTFNSVEQLRKDLESNGFLDAFIVPYINGVRVSPADVRNYTNAYPDLENYSNR
ncbi:MAG: OmpA family protein [Bacteroidetes bacterium]|nr:OmpA family protein [Bacteroidota bacterium]